MGDFTHVFAAPDADNIIDAVNPATGRSMVNDLTLDQMREREPAAELMTWDDWSAAKAARQDTPVAWLDTDAEQYDEMLSVLPPRCWSSFGFLVGEPCDHHAGNGRPRYQAYRQLHGGRYQCSSRPMTVQEFRDCRDLGERREQ